jgi:hypothetical protein
VVVAEDAAAGGEAVFAEGGGLKRPGLKPELDPHFAAFAACGRQHLPDGALRAPVVHAPVATQTARANQRLTFQGREWGWGG